MRLSVLWRLRGRARSVWIKPEGPVVAFDIVVDIFASPAFATSLNQATIRALDAAANPDGRIQSSPANMSASLSTFEDGRFILDWRLGELHFTDTRMLHNNSLISIMAVTQGSYDPTRQLESLQRQIADKLNSLKMSYTSLSPTTWHVVVGTFVAGVCVALAILVGELFGGLARLFVLIAIAACVLIVPRVQETRWRRRLGRNFIQGDNDGTIRRALATIGIELPEATPPLP